MVTAKDKILFLHFLLWVAVSCSSRNHSSSTVIEDRLFITRMYIGDFIDFKHTGPDKFGNPDLIWITTTTDSIHGKIAACSRECNFTAGERLYLRRKSDDTAKEMEWVYMIENDKSVQYMINEYINHRNVPVESWFRTYSGEDLVFITPGQKPVAANPGVVE